MSISYNATVVYGFEMDIITVRKKKTKYDENTGKPYTVMVDSHEIVEVQGVQVSSAKDNQDQVYVGGHIGGLGILESGYEEGTKVLGIALARTIDGDDFCEFEAKKHPKIEAFAKKFNVKPKLYLLLSCG